MVISSRFILPKQAEGFVSRPVFPGHSKMGYLVPVLVGRISFVPLCLIHALNSDLVLSLMNYWCDKFVFMR
jgi:hypothetical protein